jgi:ATP-dependent protease ClpP protease subunit
MRYIIPIHGELEFEKRNDTFTLNDFLLHLNNAKNSEVIHLDISSIGGYVEVADKIIDLLKNSGKVITASNSGHVMSAASLIFMSASVRTFDPTKGDFLIHNAWVEVQGEASELERQAKELRAIEKKYAQIYSQVTGVDISIIQELMNQNTPLTSEQIESMNFAHILKTEYKAVAKINLKLNKMTEEQIKENFDTLGDKILNGIKSLFKPKALVIADANGTELTMPDINDISELKIGVAATVNGEPANGEYPQPDGTILKFEGGVLVEIVPLQNEDVDALKKEIEALKSENEVLKTQNEQVSAKLIEIEKDVKEYKALASNFKPKPQTQTDVKKATFTYKKK